MSQEPNIIDEYLQLTREYESKYGNRTIVLLQVGAFFEVYGLKNVDNNTITGSNIEEFASFSQLNISEKKITHKGSQVVMAGFRDYTLDKYLQRITENDYNAVVFVQEKTGKITKRVFHGVYSAGTFVSYETDSSPQITNNIMCIWIDTCKPLIRGPNLINTKDNIIYGVSCVNIFTGKSSMFEYQTQFLMNPCTFDELERYVSTLCPSEVILISSLADNDNNTILQYVGIRTNSIHRFNFNHAEVQNCMKQKYIMHILTTFFGAETLELCKEFDNNIMSTQAFCFLMNFIKEHNPNLIKKVSLPFFNNTSDNMSLANHTLKQLNIIDDMGLDSKKTGHLSSVLSFLNKCFTAMGKRLFQYQLLNPTVNVDWLNKEYNMISHLFENLEMMDMFRKKLVKIRDFEKVCRQIVVRKIYPSSIYHLYESLMSVQQIHTCIMEDDLLCDYLSSVSTPDQRSNIYMEKSCDSILKLIDSTFYLDKCKITNSMNIFDENIIKPGVSAELDLLLKSYNEKIQLFHDVKSELNGIMNTPNSSATRDDVDYIKIHETDKSGLSLHITKTRSKLLKTIMNDPNKKPRLVSKVLDNFNYADCELSSASTNSDEIYIGQLGRASKDILQYKEKMNTIISAIYMRFLDDFENTWFSKLENIASYVAKLDVLQCKAHTARTNNYCKPHILLVDSQKSRVSVKHLRHCLIEHLQQNEIYVTNDVEMGDKTNGILLYGTNAVGKTSFIRALGIAIIMAQSGMFVPCSQFNYVPYRAIFSRILGNDNIFKGLSTFAVEMSELRIILKMADENSLILGDELCSGTESESALSIFVAGLQDLHEKGATFIFATHFHEIVHYDEVKALDKMALKHMSVIYDRELDCLVYDRKLKDGPGTSSYGLEVCKSLYLTDEFLNKAYAIRNKYFPEMKGELSQTTSHFNAKKIKGTCEYCSASMGEEVHHIDPQRNADKNGFLNTFHKNHPGNLLTVCKTCHDLLHESDCTMKKKKTTKGMLLTREV
jgi:DNA mismatch repair protein MutS